MGAWCDEVPICCWLAFLTAPPVAAASTAAAADEGVTEGADDNGVTPVVEIDWGWETGAPLLLTPMLWLCMGWPMWCCCGGWGLLLLFSAFWTDRAWFDAVCLSANKKSNTAAMGLSVLLLECVYALGYQAWSVKGGKLRSPGVSDLATVWTSREVTLCVFHWLVYVCFVFSCSWREYMVWSKQLACTVLSKRERVMQVDCK